MSTDAIIANARQYKRHATKLEARIEPHPDHAEQLRLSFPDSKAGLAVADVSLGGMGLLIGIMLPKGMRLTVHIEPSAVICGQALTIRTAVRRCAMIDHKPTYRLGLQFIEPNGPDEQALVAAATRAEHHEKQLAGAGAGVS